ncbi:hypothetical protein J4E85_009977 [Alternaria conjuncta]|uniref:uncharacterized protein n=1 Tax=Alternaria conjuncta TaxID=181017 RepID=UPI00221E5956|nr:uncharacterized protein J4E85_009977 [Alternaria conjuncta]KAI4917458.1 hypothetical protein J4E85_009977 [Alternaria conjuncta]
MRLGKPRKNRNFDGSIKREISPAGSYVPLGARMDLLPRTALYKYESSPEPTDPFYFGPRTPEYHYQDAFIGDTFSSSHSSVGSEGANSRVNAWPNDEQMLYTNNTEMFAPVPQYPPPATAFHGHVHVRSTSVSSQPDMVASLGRTQTPAAISHQFQGMPVSHDTQQEKIMASPPPMASAPLPTPPDSNIFLRHDCTQFAFQILCSLYMPPENQPTAGDFSSLDGLPSSGSVLPTNVAAVDNLYTLLSCDCSSNPHFSATVNLAIMKILSWYQAMAGGDQQGDSYPIETYMKTLPYQQNLRGALDSEQEQVYQTNLILAELCRIEKLVDKFSERYCNAANTAETGIDCAVYVAMEASLRTRVRDTFKITMSVAPENVKRQMASRTQSRLRVNTV